jgi:hypothetical protein
MTTVTLDALDAVELAEILEYPIERVDTLAEHDLAKLLFADTSPLQRRPSPGRRHPAHYRLYTSPNPLTNVGASFGATARRPNGTQNHEVVAV